MFFQAEDGIRDAQESRGLGYVYKRHPPVYGSEVADVAPPLLYEVARHLVDAQSEEVFYLRGENRDGDTAGESHDDGVGDELDDGAQMQHSEEDEEGTCHQSGNGEPLEAILLDDAIDDDDEGTRRSANLHLAASEQRDDESRHDSGDDTLLWCHSGCDTEGDGKWQCHDAHDDARHDVGHEGLLVVVPQCGEELRLEI